MPQQKSFWQTAPGTVAAIAAMVTALAGAIPVINAIRNGNETPSASTTPSPSATPSATPSASGGATTREWDPSNLDDDAVPAVVASPARLDLGKVAPGLAAGEKVVQFVNTGSEPVMLGKLRVIGPGAAAYTAEGTCGEGDELAPDDSCDVRVRFSPSAAGVYEATLVLDRAPGEPLTVPLQGASSLL